MDSAFFILGIFVIAALAIVVTSWQFRLSRRLASSSPEAYAELRFNKVGSWPGWNMARARNAFHSPIVSALPPDILLSVRRYVIIEVVYICVFAAMFCMFAIDRL